MRENLKELVRYIAVGGIAFLVDYGVLHLTMVSFPDFQYTLYNAVVAGFICGLTVNYILSLAFVFKNAKEKTENKKFITFVVFAIIGAIGLGLTELGMHIGVVVLGFHYLIIKIIVAAIVMLWNYIARKVIIFS